MIIKRTTGILMMIEFSLSHFFLVNLSQMSGLAKNPLAGLAALGLAGAIPSNTGGLNQTGITSCMKSQI